MSMILHLTDIVSGTFSSMTDNPKTMSQPRESVSQLFVIPGSNSWAKEAKREPPVGKRKVYPAGALIFGTNSWAQLDNHESLIKKAAAEPVRTLKSAPRGLFNDKPLPSLPEPPPPPYTPRLTPDKKHISRPTSPFPKPFSSLSSLGKLKKHPRAKAMVVLPTLGETQTDMEKRGKTDSVANEWCLPDKDEKSSHGLEEPTEPSCAATGSEQNCFELSPQPGETMGKTVALKFTSHPSKDESPTQLSILSLSSNISPSATSTTDLPLSGSFLSLVNQLAGKTNPTNRHLLEDRLGALALSDRHRNQRGILKRAGVRKPRRTSIFGEVRRVHFATSNATQRPLSQVLVIENEACITDKQGEIEGKTTLPSRSSHPNGSEETINYSESEYSEENEINTVSNQKSGRGRAKLNDGCTGQLSSSRYLFFTSPRPLTSSHFTR